MIVDQFITRMIAQLGNRTDLQSSMLGIMNDVKETTLESQSWFPWFLEHDTAEDSTHLVTVAGTELVQLPSRYLAQVEDSEVYLLDSNGEEQSILQKMFYADMLRKYASTDEIQAYSLRGDTMRVRGIPTEVRNIRMQYYQADDAFASGYENLWLRNAAAVVYAEVGFICASKYIKDYDMAGLFQQDANKAWKGLSDENTARQESGALRVIGE